MSGFGTLALVVLLGLVLATTAVIVLQQRRSPQSTLAWLFFLVLAPYFAVPIFVAIGFRKRHRPADHANLPPPDAPDPDTPQIERMLQSYGLPGAVPGNRLTLLPDNSAAWDGLLDAIHGAETSLDVTLYVLGRDAAGRAFCAALAEKARSGVAVRVILDRIGSWRRPRAALRELAAAGAEIRLFSPIMHRWAGGRVNLRNHRKMVIAEGVRVWAGGRNIAAEYMGSSTGQDWRDLSFRIDGPAACGFAHIFACDWIAAGGQMPNPPAVTPPKMGDSTVQLIPAGPDVAEDPLHDALVYACHAARERLWIVTPYFLPPPDLAQALAITARRGVDTRVIIPAASNQRLADLARGAWLRDLIAAGCHVHLHPDMLHAKAVLADDLAFAGSANFDARSLLLNFEVMVLLRSRADVAALRSWMESLRAEAPEGIPPAGLLRRSVEALVRLTSPIL